MSSSSEIINLTNKFIQNYKMNYKEVKISNNQIKHYNQFIEYIQNDFNDLSSVNNSEKNIKKEKILENINTDLEKIIEIINTSIKNDKANLQSVMKKIKMNIIDNTDIIQRKDGDTNDIIEKIIDKNKLLSYNYDIDGSTGYNLDDINCFFYEYKDINVIYSSALFTLFAFIKQKDPKFNFIKNKLSKYNDIKNKIYKGEVSTTINIADTELPENIFLLKNKGSLGKKQITADLINKIKLSSDLLNIIYNVLESYIDWSYINTSSIGIGGPKLLAAQICDIHFNKFFVEINPEYIQKIGPNFEYFKSNYYFEDKLKYRSKDMTSVTDMPKTLKEKFIRFQKAYAPVNINDNNNDVTNDELNSFKYNDKMDILPIFNCDIWFGDYEGYDSFTRRYRVPYPITGLTYNSKSNLNDDILNKLEFCLRMILIYNIINDTTDNIKRNFAGTPHETTLKSNIDLFIKTISGTKTNYTYDDRKNYFNNFFNDGIFKINNIDYVINKDKDNNNYLFNFEIINDNTISINDKHITPFKLNKTKYYNYYIKFALNKVATYGLYSFKENKNCFEMRSTDKDLDKTFDKVPKDENNKKCSFILIKPNNKTVYNQNLANELTEDNKSYLYKSTKLVKNIINAKRVYPINKDSFNITPLNIGNDQLGDGLKVTDEPYYWIGYYDTFSYLNCNLNFDRDEQWNEMLTYNNTEESLNDMICYSSPLNYFNLSNTEKKDKTSDAYQTNTLDKSAINALTSFTSDEFSFYENNGSIYNNNNLVGGSNSYLGRLQALRQSRMLDSDYQSPRFAQPTTTYNPSISSAFSKNPKEYKNKINDQNILVNLNNIRVGQPYMSASRVKDNSDKPEIIKNSEGIYKKIVKNGASDAKIEGDGIKFKLILDRNYNISKNSASKCRFPNRYYTNTTNIYNDIDFFHSDFMTTNYNIGSASNSNKNININKEFNDCNNTTDYENKYKSLYDNNNEKKLSNLLVGFPGLKIKNKVIDSSQSYFTDYFTNIEYDSNCNESFKGIKNMKTIGPRLPPTDFILNEYKQDDDKLSILSHKGYQNNMHKLIKNYIYEHGELKSITAGTSVIEYCIRKYIGKESTDDQRKINFVGLPIIDVFNSCYLNNYDDPSPPIKNSSVINQMRPQDCYTSCTNIDNSFRYIRYIYMTITLSLTISKVLRHYIKNLIEYYYIVRGKISQNTKINNYNKSKLIMLVNNTIYNLKNYEHLIRIVFGQVPAKNNENKIEGDLLIMQYLGIVFASINDNGYQSLEKSIEKLNKLENYFINEGLFPFITKREYTATDDIWKTTPGSNNDNWSDYLKNGTAEDNVEEYGTSFIKNLEAYDLYTFDIEKTQKSLAKLLKILPLLGKESCEGETDFNIENYCLGGISIVDSNNLINNLKVLLSMNISSGLIKEEKLMLINKYNQLKEDVLSYIPQFERDKIINQIEKNIVLKFKNIARRSSGPINDTNTLILLAKGNNSGQIGFLTLLYTYLLKYKNMSGANTANINKTLAKYPGITKKKGLFNLNSLLNSDPNEANKANNDFNKLAKEKRQLEKVRFQTEFYFKETIRQLRVLYIANIIPLGYYYWCVCKIQNMIIDMKLTYDEIISNKNSFSEAQQKRLYKDIGYGNGITSRMLNTLAKRKTISNLLDKVSLIDNECYERQFWIKRETEFNETNKTYLNIDSNTNNYYHWVLYLPVVLYETIEYPVGSGNMKDIKRSALIDIFKFAQEGYSNIRNNYTFNDINNANDVVNIQKSGGRIKKQFNNDTNLYKSNTHGYKEVPSIIYLEDLFKVDNNLYMSNFQSVIGNYEQLPVYCKKINKAKYTKNNTNIFNYENDTYFKVRPMILSGSEKTFNSLLKSGNIKNDKCNIPFFLIDCRNNSTMSQKYIRVLFYQLLYSLPATYDPNKLYDYYDNLINKWINLEKTKYSDIKDGKKEKNIEETYNFEQERLVDSSASTTLIEKKIKKNNDNNEIIELSFLNVNALINAKDIYGKSEWIDTRGSVIDNDKMNKFLNKFKFNFTTNFRTSLLIGSTLNNLPYNSDFKVNMPPSIPDTDPYIKTDLIRINNYNIDENLNYYLPYKMNTINSGSIDYNNYLPGNTVNIQEYLSRHKFSSTMNIYRDYFLRRFRTNFYLPALWRLKTTNLVDNSGNMNEFNPKYEGRTRNKLMVDSNLFSKLSPIISDLATDKSKQNIVDRRIKAKGYESGNTCFVSIIQLKKLLLSYEEPEGVLDSFGAKIGNNDTLKNDFFENL